MMFAKITYCLVKGDETMNEKGKKWFTANTIIGIAGGVLGIAGIVTGIKASEYEKNSEYELFESKLLDKFDLKLKGVE